MHLHYNVKTVKCLCIVAAAAHAHYVRRKKLFFHLNSFRTEQAYVYKDLNLFMHFAVDISDSSFSCFFLCLNNHTHVSFVYKNNFKLRCNSLRFFTLFTSAVHINLIFLNFFVWNWSEYSLQNLMNSCVQAIWYVASFSSRVHLIFFLVSTSIQFSWNYLKFIWRFVLILIELRTRNFR